MGEITELPPRPTLVPQTGGNLAVTQDNFWARGQAMIANAYPENAPVIRLGTPEYEAWATYFRNHLRWQPWALRALEAGSLQGMTVPAQWPEWFDSNYTR